MSEAARAPFNDANAYEGYVGRWSRLIAQQFVPWLNAGPQRVWLDAGAGTGLVTRVILEQAAPQAVVALDPSERYLAHARQVISDERVEFITGDLDDAALDSRTFDVVVAGLVLNFMPSPQDGVRGMARAAAPGGIVAAYVWDYRGGMEMFNRFWTAAMSLDPAAIEAEAGTQYAICEPDALYRLFEEAGLSGIDVTPIDIQTRFQSFDDYWLPFLGAQGSVAKYLRSLDAERQAALRDTLARQLPVGDDGAIDLTARAWAVKGVR